MESSRPPAGRQLCLPRNRWTRRKPATRAASRAAGRSWPRRQPTPRAAPPCVRRAPPGPPPPGPRTCLRAPSRLGETGPVSEPFHRLLQSPGIGTRDGSGLRRGPVRRAWPCPAPHKKGRVPRGQDPARRAAAAPGGGRGRTTRGPSPHRPVTHEPRGAREDLRQALPGDRQAVVAQADDRMVRVARAGDPLTTAASSAAPHGSLTSLLGTPCIQAQTCRIALTAGNWSWIRQGQIASTDTRRDLAAGGTLTSRALWTES